MNQQQINYMNSTEAKATATNPPGTSRANRMVRGVFSWRCARRMAFVCACLVTLLALGITIENWRGRKAWEQYAQSMEARGEKLDFNSLLPGVIPDEQNFFMAPVFSGTFNQMMDPKTGKIRARDPEIKDRLTMTRYIGHGKGDQTPSDGDWMRGRAAHLTVWQQYYSAATNGPSGKPEQSPDKTGQGNEARQWAGEAVVSALGKFESQRAELLAAAERPGAQLQMKYDAAFAGAMDLIGPMQKFRTLAQFFTLHASAELASGNTAAALDDEKILFRMVSALRTDPTLVSQMIRIALLHISIQPLWEGLATHQWTEAQIMALSSQLDDLDLLKDYPFTMRSERAFNLWMMDGTLGNPRHTPFPSLMPQGWIYQNRVSFCVMYQDWILPMVDVEHRLLSPAKVRQMEQGFKAAHSRISPYDFFTGSLFPALSRSVQAFARAQASVDLARVGCALERYFLADHRYPETLQALVPQFIRTLPRDVINGEPLKYRLNADGGFVLYSVGWDEHDDGGTVILDKDGNVDRKRGDWVWKYPESL
jgi:hypothetical protein